MDQLTLGERLLAERDAQASHGLYYWTTIVMTYNSNHLEGSTLSPIQTQQLYDTGSVTPTGEKPLKLDDLIETKNHFKAFDYMLDHCQGPLSHDFVCALHRLLKSGTSQADKNQLWNIGGYKKFTIQIGFFNPVRTAPPDKVKEEMEEVFRLGQGLPVDEAGIDSALAEFHATFERIHPFSDGNGRIGRLLLFKECLRLGLTPPVIFDDEKDSYIHALSSWTLSHPDELAAFIRHSRERYTQDVLDKFKDAS